MIICIDAEEEWEYFPKVGALISNLITIFLKVPSRSFMFNCMTQLFLYHIKYPNLKYYSDIISDNRSIVCFFWKY